MSNETEGQRRREPEIPEPHPSDEAVRAAYAAAGQGTRAMLEAAYRTDAARIKGWLADELRAAALAIIEIERTPRATGGGQ